jgi:acyl dehydratase
MAGDTLITDELRKQIGVAKQSNTIEMEKGMLRQFVDSVGDPNPLWSDEEYAKKSQYGGITFPPSILAASLMGGSGPWLEVGLQRILDGGGEWEFLKPIRPGDVITVVGTIGDLREREGGVGKMLFIISDIEWKNQRGEVVATGKSTIIRY